MQASYSGYNRSIKYLFENAAEVSVEQILTAGTPIATVTVDGDDVDLYAPAGGGSNVIANPVGTPTDDLDTIEIDGVIYDIPGSGGGSVMMSDYYSTEERVVGRWTDGKPLYQKTVYINGTFGPNTYDLTVFDASSLNVDNICFSFASFGYGTPLPYAHPDIRWSATYYVDSDKLFKICTGGSSIITDMVLTLQYTKTTDTAGTGPTPGNLVYLPALYSEEEREIGVWTDGKPLYQKVFHKNGLPTNADDVVCNEPSNIDTMVSMEDHFHFPSAVDVGNNFYASSSDQYRIYRYQGKINVGCYTTRSASEMAASSIDVVIQYTKTTDQPGSGKYLPDGQYAHHYSENEQIVGTWIDGKTRYERTYILKENNVDKYTYTSNEYQIGLTGVDKVWITEFNAIRSNGTYIDSRNVSDEVMAVFNKTAGSIYYYDLHGYTYLYLTVQYTKSS